MAQAEFVQDGDVIDYTPAVDVGAGTVVVREDLVGVTKRDIKANALGSLAVSGVYDLTKASGAGVTFAAGAKVFWDATNHRAVATAGQGDVNKLVGKATVAAADADATVRTRLSQ